MVNNTMSVYIPAKEMYIFSLDHIADALFIPNALE